MAADLKLIVGLGNPGPQYQNTRHNVGFAFVDQLADSNQLTFKLEKKFKAFISRANIDGCDCVLLKPDTFMNLSGDAVQKAAHFYKITPDNIIVAHDDLDIDCGKAKWKLGGGHGGHNGLRDIISCFSTSEFYRLRIGIGHPGAAHLVTNFVLSRASKDEHIEIQRVLYQAERTLSFLLDGDIAFAMNELHAN